MPTVLAIGAAAVVALAWMALLLLNAGRAWQAWRLEPEERPDARARNVWIASVAGLFLGCPVAAVTWVVLEWVLRPVDPMEDPVGSIRLLALARTNVTFVLVVSAVVIVAACLRGLTGPLRV